MLNPDNYFGTFSEEEYVRQTEEHFKNLDEMFPDNEEMDLNKEVEEQMTIINNILSADPNANKIQVNFKVDTSEIHFKADGSVVIGNENCSIRIHEQLITKIFSKMR